MIYFIDTEFDGFGGDLISLAIVREDGQSLYLQYQDGIDGISHPWVHQNVKPNLNNVPDDVKAVTVVVPDLYTGSRYIKEFLDGDSSELILIHDWPEDAAWFARALLTGPGTMIGIQHYTLKFFNVQAYPTDLNGAVQHNAWWDAMALRHLFYKTS